MPPRKRKETAARSLEATLWEAADKLRGNLEASEYKHVVLGLVFLKYVSDAFTQHRTHLEASLADPESEDYIPNEPRREKLLESRDEYAGANVFWVPPEARWDHLQLNAKQPKIGAYLDDAMDLLELENPKQLEGVLPKNYAREDLDKRLLGELIGSIGSIGFTEVDHGSDDALGKVYEYFLGKFAGQERRGAGEFYTPRSVVRLLVEMLEPFSGRVYDPCCGSGGMFVQSAEFVAAHGGRRTDISVYGQEFVGATWRLARMNLALRGIDADLSDQADDTFHRDQHPGLRADYILANPPFNKDDWFSEALADDPRNRYTNRALTTAEIIAELVRLAKEMREQAQRHESLGLSVAEAAFYDAIASNESAVLTMGDDTLKQISVDLVWTVQQSATIDWSLKDSVKAAMRAKVRRLLAKYDYPPDLEDAAVELVLEQAEQYALAG